MGFSDGLKYLKNARCCFCLENGWKENSAAHSLAEKDDESDCEDSNHKSFLREKEEPLVFGDTRTPYFIIITPVLQFESLLEQMQIEGGNHLNITQKTERYNFQTYAMATFHCLNLKKRIVSSNFIHKSCPTSLHNCIATPFFENGTVEVKRNFAGENFQNAVSNFVIFFKM